MGLQRDQDGVISRQQMIKSDEFGDERSVRAEIRRRLRGREWSTLLPGVYVDHTGPPTWRQEAWGAVLFYAPAALAGPSALHAWRLRGFDPEPGAPVSICVDRSRGVRRRVGVHVRQIARMDTLCVMDAGIPRQRVEHALIDVASAHRHLDDCVAVLADAVQEGRTTVPRLRDALSLRTRVRHRALMREVLDDVEGGVRSALEHRFVNQVERAHGLPASVRQRLVVVGGASTYRDAEYDEFGVVVELDGRVAHEGLRAQARDVERDIDAAISGQVTIRPGWRHVLEPCRLAESVGSLLRARGWTGHVTPCGEDCATTGPSHGPDVAQTS